MSGPIHVRGASRQGNWSWFTVKQLVHTSPESLAQYRTGSEIQIVGPSLKSCHHLRRKLAELAIPFQEAGQLDNSITQRGDIDVCIEYTVDRTILRAIGKIALTTSLTSTALIWRWAQALIQLGSSSEMVPNPLGER